MKVSRILGLCAILMGFNFSSMAEVVPATTTNSSARNTATSASSRTSANRNTSRTTSSSRNTSARSVVSRTATTPTASTTAATSRTATPTTSRTATTGTATRGTTSRTATTRGTTATTGTSRAVTSRTATTGTARNVNNRTTTSRGTSTARTASSARVGMIATGTSRASSYISKLYSSSTTDLGDLLDSKTGYISDSAYNTCKDNYFECMDLVCTTRAPAKKRCACSDRINAYTDIENQLEEAKLQLLQVSNNLTLLIASGGDADLMAAAYTQSDAEKVLKCVSACKNETTNNDIIASYGCKCADYEYLGSDSDIYSQIQAISDLVNDADSSTGDDTTLYAWGESINTVSEALNKLSGYDSGYSIDEDNYANLWGTDLLKFADPMYEKSGESPKYKSSNPTLDHITNAGVCTRVIDMCFNGIYNTVTEADELNGTSYSTSSNDPYQKYRPLIQSGRTSIRDLYAFNANADCDEYNTTLKKQVTNMKTQLVAAQALLQKKRLEFKNTSNTDTATRRKNYNNCYNEVVNYCNEENGAVFNWSQFRVCYSYVVSEGYYCSSSMPLQSGLYSILESFSDSSSASAFGITNTSSAESTTTQIMRVMFEEYNKSLDENTDSEEENSSNSNEEEQEVACNQVTPGNPISPDCANQLDQDEVMVQVWSGNDYNNQYYLITNDQLNRLENSEDCSSVLNQNAPICS